MTRLLIKPNGVKENRLFTVGVKPKQDEQEQIKKTLESFDISVNEGYQIFKGEEE